MSMILSILFEGTNVNSMSVHTDCVEDVDTLLADICFNEDLYAKPPTVEFTVTDHNASAGISTTSKVRRASTSNIASSSSSSSNSNNNNSTTSSSTIIRDSAAILNSSSGNGRSEILATTTTPNNRLRKVRTPLTEPSAKSVHSSVKEVPFDNDEEKDMTVYISGRNRVVYYGINGSPYYITDSGK